MSRWLHFFGSLALISCSIPLAVLAAITTTLAFNVLFIRAAVVYAELAFALIRAWLLVDSHSVPPPQFPRVHEREAYQVSSHYNSTLLSASGASSTNHPPKKSESFSSLLGSNNPNRDFEGVGGWSLGKDVRDDTVWMMNSRLELAIKTTDHGRRHHRRFTSSSLRLVRSPERNRKSPVESRDRTPTTADGVSRAEGYFGARHSGQELETMRDYINRQRILSSSVVSSPGTTRTLRF